ncbi:MAG: FHA domain-containing protein [Gammaproteobacteria bacterium]|nr:FHA domain-containing protein [Gammaproteobacteria bacterium]
MATIQLIFNGQVKQTYSIDKPEFTIGRKEVNDIFIDNKSISGRHAVIIRKDDHYIISDLDSTNGTKVNGKKIKTIRLNEGDHISLFKYTLSFSLDGEVLGESEETQKNKSSSSSSAGIMVGDDATVMLNSSQISQMAAEYKADGKSESEAKEASLEVTTADDITTIQIKNNPIIIGRNSRCKIQTGGWPIFTPAISAVIKKDMSGTYSLKPETTISLNGQKISKKQLLKNNDRILIRDTLIIFQIG